jgi:hypothetical protein
MERFGQLWKNNRDEMIGESFALDCLQAIKEQETPQVYIKLLK